MEAPRRYVISYDLNTPGKDYKTLIQVLERLGAKRVLYSQWAVRWNNTTAAAIRDYVRQCIDAGDRVLVMCVDNADWASWNAMTDLNTI